MLKHYVLLAVLLALFAIPISATYTDFYTPKETSIFSVIGTSGDVYYEDRCIDVSKYLLQGYKSSGTDENGCPLASSTVVLGYLDYGSSFKINIYDKCKDRYGSAWTRADYYVGDEIVSDAQILAGISYSTLSNNRYQYCITLGKNTKGGMEQVMNTCNYDQNDLLVGETFAGGQSITKSSLRYPIKSFCRGHPSIITDDATKQSITSTNIPQDLIDGKSVSISSSQTLTVFYVIENNQNLPTICDSSNNLALDAQDPTLCKSTLGFTYLCSEGQYDALTGTCVVQPESKALCDMGRYDINLDMCVWNPPIQAECGNNACFYSVDDNICKCVTQEEFICPDGMTIYMPNQAECEAKGDTWLICPQCPTDKICPSSVCSPRCAEGITCGFKPTESISECKNIPGTIIDAGRCKLNETTLFRICPEDMKYNEEKVLCESVNLVQTESICEDGSQPQINSITGKEQCVAVLESFTECPQDFVYNIDSKKCVPEIIMIDPVTKDVIIYKEVYKQCTSDSECNVVGADFKCYKDNGLCYKDINTLSKSTILSIIIASLIVGAVLIYYFKKKKR